MFVQTTRSSLNRTALRLVSTKHSKDRGSYIKVCLNGFQNTAWLEHSLYLSDQCWPRSFPQSKRHRTHVNCIHTLAWQWQFVLERFDKSELYVRQRYAGRKWTFFWNLDTDKLTMRVLRRGINYPWPIPATVNR